MKALLKGIRELILSARTAVVHSIDTIQVYTNFEIGHRIVVHEQQGAEYGEAILKELSNSLMNEFGRGFSQSNLEYMRKFYLAYKDRIPQISQMPSAKLPTAEKSQMASGKLAKEEKSQTLSDESSVAMTLLATSGKGKPVFTLSWSQYVLLISINDPDERRFYEIEALDNGWTLPGLKRQFKSGLYERLALSRDKDDICRLSWEGQIVTQPQDLLYLQDKELLRQDPVEWSADTE